ncbi:solute carrier family 22 member 20-like [Pleurodeles waltl]|uniref:solute carrier family 22 member 20-like n=1 Tax=Pleurodeles waltl TaxID=8319 RepID=UPI003709657C
MGFNYLIEAVGGVGCFQIIFIIFSLLSTTMSACQIFVQNFSAHVTAHHCHLPFLSNETRRVNLTHKDFLKAFIPVGANQQLERCFRFTTPQWGLLTTNDTEVNRTEAVREPCSDGWTYDTSLFSSTIVSEWDLVCNLQDLRQLSQSVFMAGVLLGAIVFGRLADRFGRRALIILSYLQMSVAGTCAAFLPSFILYCSFRFLTGMAFSGLHLSSISLILEWMPIRGRTMAVSLPGQGFPLGQLLVAGVAYGIRDWRWLQFAVSAPFYLIFLLSWFIPESARWLILNDRTPEAINNLRKVARINGKQEESQKLTVELIETHMKEASSMTPSTSFLDLVRTPGIRRISCCLMFLWFSTSLGFYALAMDLQNFGLSLFLVQVCFGTFDIFATQASISAMDFFGRRLSLSFSLLIAGLLIIANIFVPQEMHMVRTALATTGKGCFASAFSILFTFSGELYPTVIRQTGLGFLSMIARAGAILAPLIHMIANYVSFLPPVIFSASAIMAGLTAYTLLETRNSTLLDTVEEVEIRVKGKPLPEVEAVPLTQKNGTILPQTV